MRISISIFKPIALSIVAIAVMAVSYGSAKADEITVTGTSGGCFNAACPPGSTGQAQTATLLGLTYNGSSFSVTTSSGFAGIGAVANPPSNVDNLGSFTVNTTPNTYNGNTFTLRLTFTAPAGITGGNPQDFTATLIGSVTSLDHGGVFVDFNNTPVLFSFSNASGSGSFSLSVNDVSITAGHTAAVTGNVTGGFRSTIPEPASMLLFGIGLLGMAGACRRRLKAHGSD